MKLKQQIMADSWDYEFPISNIQANHIVDLADNYAIEFAEWIRVCKLKGRSYDFDNIEELLTIYKEEKRL
jgi:hypothetical protein